MCPVLEPGIVLLDGRAKKRRKKDEKMNQTAGQLIADPEYEFDLLCLQRHVTDLEQRDELLVEEIDVLRRARIEAPSATTHEVSPESP